MESSSVIFLPKLSSSRVLLYLILIFTFINYNDASPADTSAGVSESVEFDYVQRENSMVAIYIMYSISLLTLQFGSFCALYVIIRTIIRWMRVDSSLNMAQKLPFYVALSVNKQLWHGHSCEILAASFYYFAISNMLLVGSLSVLSYFRVCKTIYYELGLFDYKLFLLPIVLPVVMTIPAWKHFGANGYWCYANRASSFIPLSLFYVAIVILSTSLFCYIGISYTINVARRNADSELFLHAYKKIVGYLFIYIIQWTPVMIYVLVDNYQHRPMWEYVICFISLPLGGMLNAYRYISNEGWRTKKDVTVSSTSNTVQVQIGPTTTSNSVKSSPLINRFDPIQVSVSTN
ncbi:10512_t:CDS:2 [Funneliformis geosporum]|uniref:19240_t:CDS:1 n=1 Tax=Funneliformis geosporum TaxID=1117311 RepID=A0A9W4ST30_9GLOM|nr:19240_t:CDS:2 [Funneliformis geosporum]CAI2184437.1 10512_t:CDS:2 [Funneliformis geosporum]